MQSLLLQIIRNTNNIKIVLIFLQQKFMTNYISSQLQNCTSVAVILQFCWQKICNFVNLIAEIDCSIVIFMRLRWLNNKQNIIIKGLKKKRIKKKSKYFSPIPPPDLKEDVSQGLSSTKVCSLSLLRCQESTAECSLEDQLRDHSHTVSRVSLFFIFSIIYFVVRYVWYWTYLTLTYEVFIMYIISIT